jgi:hypothetical protein
VPLRAIKELRNAQLEEFERLEIGSKLPIPVTPLKGSGKTREFLGQGRAAFAYKIYVQLERERNLPRHPAHLESIRESYKEYFEQNPEPEDNYSKEGVPKLIRAGEAKVWNRSNRWKAEAALLRPLSADNDVLESWTQAGFELVVFLTRNLSQLKPLLDFLKNKITESTDAPSRKKIKTEVTSALRDGFRSILSGSRRTQDAPPASNNPRN